MESDETDSLKNAISISIKMCLKSLFGKENRKDQRNQLQEGDDQAHIADRIIAFSNYKKKWNDGWINVVNPFRASMVLAAHGSGKSYEFFK